MHADEVLLPFVKKNREAMRLTNAIHVSQFLLSSEASIPLYFLTAPRKTTLFTLMYLLIANHSCMALALVRCSIEANREGTPYARARVRLVSWEGGSHAVLFMVPLGPSGVRRTMAQVLRLPLIIIINVPANFTDKLQPLDLSVKKPFKDERKKCFQPWYAEEVQKQLTSVTGIHCEA